MSLLQILLWCGLVFRLSLTQPSTQDVTPPEFLGPCDAAVFETVPVGTLVTRCFAMDFSDATNSTTNTSLTYQITGGNTEEAFKLSEVGMGSIETQRELDREATDFYQLTVTATDDAGLDTSIQIRITITDVNDNAPMFLSPPPEVLLTTARILGYVTELVTLEATDADTGLSGEFIFTLAEVTHLPGDMATELLITVTDFGQVRSGLGVAQLSSNHTVRVSFESACLEQDYAIDPLGGVLSGRFLCSVEVVPAEINMTIGETRTIGCHIEKNVDGEHLWLQNGNIITPYLLYLQDTSSAALQLFNARIEDSGEYVCRARIRTSIGVRRLDSPTVIVRVIPGIYNIIPVIYCK